MVNQGKEKGEINWEIGIDMCTLLYIKEITNKDTLYSIENSTQYSIVAYFGKKNLKNRGYVYMYNQFTLWYSRN